jgi:hypothetical protein
MLRLILSCGQGQIGRGLAPRLAPARRWRRACAREGAGRNGGLRGATSSTRPSARDVEAGRHPGAWFARRDKVAEWALGPGRALTPRGAPVMPVE